MGKSLTVEEIELREIQKEAKKVLLQGNRTVKRPITRLDKDINREIRQSHLGKKKRFTPTKMKHAINSYFEWCETEDEVPSIKGMVIHLKMTRTNFYQYATYPAFTELIEQAKMHILHWLENDVYQSPGMAAGKIAYMKNLHGWADKIDSTSQVTQTVITVDQARAKIEMLAPKLLELLKNETVMKQISKKAEKEEIEEIETPVLRRV